MLIAHAPSGYILSSTILRKAHAVPAPCGAVIAAAILGALAPDFDMLYLHFVDHGRIHHHRYITHWPIFWLGLIALSSAIYALWRRSAPAFLSLVFGLGGFLHVILDSLVGDILWFAPFLDKPYALFAVSARYKPWWLSFLLHWSFAVEIIICLWACVLYRRRQHRHPGNLTSVDAMPVVIEP